MIRQAFEELLQERGFHKITVTDIVERADLNRSTFYAHYPDIYGIVEEMQEQIVQRNMELIPSLVVTLMCTIGAVGSAKFANKVSERKLNLTAGAVLILVSVVAWVFSK